MIYNSNNSSNSDNNNSDSGDYEDDNYSTTSTETLSSDGSEDDYYMPFNFDFNHNSFRSDYHSNNNALSQNYLLIPEIFNKYIHGKTNLSDPTIDGQFLVLQILDYKNSNNNNNNRNCERLQQLFRYTNGLCNFYKKYYNKNFNGLNHNIIRNYSNIVLNNKYLNLEIGRIYYLKGHECVCVLKTFWIKIIQRAWKKIFKIRKQIEKLRYHPRSILYWHLTGRWPENCNHMPSLYGILN